ncbi:hypothetical protein HanIR_Chr12g0581951 [Helianthus annuus]|nr:hypothetical protein HanIR_Chr12g0581951 [Helianthus annuus]
MCYTYRVMSFFFNILILVVSQPAPMDLSRQRGTFIDSLLMQQSYMGDVLFT